MAPTARLPLAAPARASARGCRITASCHVESGGTGPLTRSCSDLGPRRRGAGPGRDGKGVVSITPVVPLQVPLVDSKFCRDAFNVHGPRDSFREIVKQGPGLHICITQPAARTTTPCDLHLDQVQQGQVCSRGFCIPIINGQTIEHLRTVAPWLAEEAKKWSPKL